MAFMHHASSHHAFFRFVYSLSFMAVLLSPLRATTIATAETRAVPIGSNTLFPLAYQYVCLQQNASRVGCTFDIPQNSGFTGGRLIASASAGYGSVAVSAETYTNTRPFLVPGSEFASASASFDDTLTLIGNSDQAYLQVVFRTRASSYNTEASGSLRVTSSSSTEQLPLCSSSFACEFGVGNINGFTLPVSFGQPIQISMTANVRAVRDLRDGEESANLSSSIIAISVLASRPDCTRFDPNQPLGCSITLYQEPAYYVSASGASYPVSGAAPVPEPSSLFMLTTGLAGLFATGWRQGFLGRRSKP